MSLSHKKRGSLILILGIIIIVFISGCSPQEPQKAADNQEQKVQATEPQKAAQDPKKLTGWWKEIESWSLDFQTGQLKKNEQAFPFLREFTEKYTCQQYDAEFHCIKNLPYAASGNKLTYEGVAGYSEEWNIVEEKLELAKKDPKGKTLSKSVSAKVSPQTSPDRKIPDYLNANLELVKTSENGLCLKHNGGDVIYLTDIKLNIDGQTTTPSTFMQFPSQGDFFFYPGESFMLRGAFKVGSKVSIMLARTEFASPLPQKELISWTIDKLVKEASIVKDPTSLGFASCP